MMYLNFLSIIVLKLKNYNKINIRSNTLSRVDTFNKYNFVLFLAIFLAIISCNFIQDIYAISSKYY